MILRTLASAALMSLAFGVSTGWAEEQPGGDAGKLDPAAAERVARKAPYSPYAGRNFPSRPFFGDTHLHTSFSMDAGACGARRDPRAGYRVARGEAGTGSSR